MVALPPTAGACPAQTQFFIMSDTAVVSNYELLSKHVFRAYYGVSLTPLQESDVLFPRRELYELR
ncbi:Uncharacterised protein [Rothia dentocariosa]|nr:Uncharacterised protein [Rothia dentocariosa]